MTTLVSAADVFKVSLPNTDFTDFTDKSVESVKSVVQAFSLLLNQLCVSGWTDLAVFGVYVGANLFQLPALTHQSHHVTRDVYTNRSAKSVIIKHDRAIRTELLDVAIQIAHVAHRPAGAKARELGQHVGIGDGKAIGILDL